MKKSTLSIIFCIVSLMATAQQNKIDSLKNVLTTLHDDTNKVITLNSICYENWQIGNYDIGRHYADSALALGEKIKYQQGIAKAYRNMAIIYSLQNDYKQAERYYAAALKIFTETKDKKGISSTYSNLGILSYLHGNYTEALKNHFYALELQKDIKDSEAIAKCYNNIGLVYLDQGRFPEALKNYIGALKIFEKTGYKKGIANNYNNIGQIYKKQKNLPEALKNFFTSLKIAEGIGDKNFIATAYYNIADVYYTQGKYSEALKNHFTALKIYKEIGYKKGMAESYSIIGDVYVDQSRYKEALENYTAALKIDMEIGDPLRIAVENNNIGNLNIRIKKTSEAIKHLNSSLDISKKLGSKNVMKVSYNLLSKAYEASGNFKKALAYHHLYTTMNDSIFNEENTKQIVQMKEQYESDKKDQQIALLNKDKILHEQNATIQLKELQKQKIIRNSTIGGLSLVLILAAVLFFRFNEKKKANAMLEKALRDLKSAQSHLVQSEKMASLGQLTAGVAHEINNPINFVSANIKPLRRNFNDIKEVLGKYENAIVTKQLAEQFKDVESFKKENDFAYTLEEVSSLIKGIEDGANRTAEIVKGLRNFSRLDESQMKEANINEGMESTLVLLQNKMNEKNIEVIKSLGDLPEINCYPSQLNQVFMNLISNSIDAIGENGKISISTSAENSHIKVSVRDTGKGMSEEIKKKIFDPFFTTKDVGKGTGLGLSVSYGIIEKHNGKIEVVSEIGKGSEFYYYFTLEKLQDKKSCGGHACLQKKLQPPFLFFLELKKEKLLSLKVKQPTARKENTVLKIGFNTAFMEVQTRAKISSPVN